jgi:hypothetical protein
MAAGGGERCQRIGRHGGEDGQRRSKRKKPHRESHRVELHPLDGYLLDGVPGKAEAIAAALRERSDDPKAQPFYRALQAVGVRAADEALLALRIVLGGGTPDDATIIAARDARRRVKAGEEAARESYERTVGTIGTR